MTESLHITLDHDRRFVEINVVADPAPPASSRINSLFEIDGLPWWIASDRAVRVVFGYPCPCSPAEPVSIEPPSKPGFIEVAT